VVLILDRFYTDQRNLEFSPSKMMESLSSSKQLSYGSNFCRFSINKTSDEHNTQFSLAPSSTNLLALAENLPRLGTNRGRRTAVKERERRGNEPITLGDFVITPSSSTVSPGQTVKVNIEFNAENGGTAYETVSNNSALL
jgi:hypothetical protein